MAIRKLGSSEERQAIGELLKKETESWKTERLIAVKLGMDSSRTLEGISETVGRGTATVQRWFTLYQQSGLDGLLKRSYGKGRPSTLDDQIQEFLLKGLTEGRWNTANPRISYKSILSVTSSTRPSGIGSKRNQGF